MDPIDPGVLAPRSGYSRVDSFQCIDRVVEYNPLSCVEQWHNPVPTLTAYLGNLRQFLGRIGFKILISKLIRLDGTSIKDLICVLLVKNN